MKLNLFNRILKLNGIINLNPYECREEFFVFIKKKSQNSYLNLFQFLNIPRFLFVHFKGLYGIYKKFFTTKFLQNEVNLKSKNLIISYEDCISHEMHDKYYGELVQNLKQSGKNDISEVHIDVFGSKSSRKSILHLISFSEGVFLFLVSQLLFIYLLFNYIFSFLLKDIKIRHFYYELLNQPNIYRLLFWDFAFKKLFKYVSKDSSILFLLEGASWEWLLLYHCSNQMRISGYIHAIARPDQYSLYSLVDCFKNYKNFSILVSENWSLIRLENKCGKNLILKKVENLRFNNLKNNKKELKNNIDLLIIGGLDGNLSKDLLGSIAYFLKNKNFKNMNILVKEHPGNKKIFPLNSHKFFMKFSEISLPNAIYNAKAIFVSGYSAACIDVKSLGKKSFIFLPKQYLDLCPLPIKNRNLISSKKVLYKILENLEKAYKNTIDFEMPFFSKDNVEVVDWIVFFN